MYPSLIAHELRARGHDVVSVHESPGSGTADDHVLDHARSEGRAVITENVRDFRPLAGRLLAASGSHAGLVFTTEKRWPRSDPGALITGIDAMLTSTPGELVDTETWLWDEPSQKVCSIRLTPLNSVPFSVGLPQILPHSRKKICKSAS